MPIYEYRCQSCGHEFETIQKVSEGPLTDCPACAKSELIKKVSAAGFRLKGGGWYETDFKSGGKKNVIGGEAAGESGKTESAGPEGGAKPKPAADGGTGAKSSGGETSGAKSPGTSTGPS